jgi:hypothetical protein
MSRWKRCGIPKESPQQSISFMIRRLRAVLDGQAPCNGVPRKIGCYEGISGGHDTVRAREIWDLYTILLLEHFQFEHPFGCVRQYVDMLLTLSQEYFSEKWIDGKVYGEGECCPIYGKCTLELYRKNMGWMDEFQIGILVALIMDDKKGLHEITQWINGVFCQNEFGYMRIDIDYNVVLGKYLNQGHFHESLTNSIKNQRRKRPKFCTEMLEAVDQKDSKRFVKFFIEYHKLFDRNECDKETFLLCKSVNINGSILWNLASRRGLEDLEFSENIMDRVITPQTLGLDT